jgi:3-carboxy-cis,cis-muconate cycloisomerase
MASVFAGIYARGAAAGAVSGGAWLGAMLEAEAALARACARAGQMPVPAAEAIAAACREEELDPHELSREAAEHTSPVVPLVQALRARVGPDLARYVHLGATSQDILDTAAMLVSHRACGAILTDARTAARAAARLAEEHRETVMAGRTLLQHALPISFGLRAAGWMVGVDTATRRLAGVRERELVVQMGGPVGSREPAIAAAVASELGLAAPVIPWDTMRVPIGSLASAVGVLAGALAKVARDVTLLAQSEVGELREGASGRGRSTAMAHKRNPVAAISVLACARRVPGLVATLLGAMEQELERAAGAWQAEWGTLSDLLALGGSAASWTRDLLEHLEVEPDRMRANLTRLAKAGVTEAADPRAHLGGASELIDRALAAHRS